jgi:VIT1/CCC1 family predicted Fe2+/Mn2+ transporter
MATINREYLRSVMFGIENSVISTAGLIAGISVGNGTQRVVILGATVAIVIEAVAMGVGEYLSDDAVQELDKLKRHADNSLLSGLMMMVSGTIAGLIPLVPVIVFDYPLSLYVSIALALATLFAVGFTKGKVLNSSPLRGGLKIFFVGGVATLLGVIVGLIFKV